MATYELASELQFIEGLGRYWSEQSLSRLELLIHYQTALRKRVLGFDASHRLLTLDIRKILEHAIRREIGKEVMQ